MPFGYLTSIATLVPNPIKAMFKGISHLTDLLLSKISLQLPRITFGRVKRLEKMLVIKLKGLIVPLSTPKWGFSNIGIINRTQKKKIKSKNF